MNTQHHQRGAVLVVSLVVALFLMIGSMAFLETSVLRTRLDNVDSDFHLAFQAAEAARRKAEKDLRNEEVFKTLEFNSQCDDGYCKSPTKAEEIKARLSGILTTAWWDKAGKHQEYSDYKGSLSGAKPHNVSESPKYIIEELSKVDNILPGDDLALGYPPLPPGVTGDPRMRYYRITARGTGKRDDTFVYVRSVIEKMID